jgi:hypothetical protein
MTVKIAVRGTFLFLVFTAGTVLLTGGAVEAGAFVRTDANQDGSTDISDAVLVLMHLFVDASPVDCMDAADANDSGAVDISDPVYILTHLFLGGPAPGAPFPECGEDPTDDDVGCEHFSNGSCPPLPPPSGQLIGHSACKSDLELLAAEGPSECIYYEFDSSNKLSLQHTNVVFNCCPEKITATVKVEGGVIDIVEAEEFGEGSPCFCLCPFDLALEVTDLTPGTYTIHAAGPDEGGVSFTVELLHGASGSHCEPRSGYPWE